MTDPSGATAGELVAQTQRELAEIAEAIRSHRFLERLRTRAVPEDRLRALAGEQHAIVSSDRRSFAQLAARFPFGLPGHSSSAWPKAKAWRWTSCGAWPIGSA